MWNQKCYFLIPVNLEIKTSSAAPISGSLEAQSLKKNKKKQNQNKQLKPLLSIHDVGLILGNLGMEQSY